ncbi:MAG: NADP-dependent oxidoreductase [Chloroflexota bacterium]|nr:MAG: NADP-dependent oxidoreductase [Chloroflexota bacterium]
MKAVRVNGWGQPVQVEDIARPEHGSNEVLVRVHAASVNPFDSFMHAGYMQGMVSTPLTLGTDFAGEVVAVGAEIGHVKAGDAVYGLVPMHSGSFAEYVVAKANEVAHKPKTLDFVQAAGVPLCSLAAYQSLFDLGEAKKGERVLIIGAAGNVGNCAIQFAKELGAYVFGVDVAERAEIVKSLGADRFIDSKTERYEDVVGTVDLVLDFVGGDNLQRSLSVLKPGGRYVTSLMLTAAQEEAERRGIRVAGLATQPRVDQLDELARRIDSGRLKTLVNSTFPLDEAQAALLHRLTRKGPGKIVLTI